MEGRRKFHQVRAAADRVQEFMCEEDAITVQSFSGKHEHDTLPIVSTKKRTISTVGPRDGEHDTLSILSIKNRAIQP